MMLSLRNIKKHFGGVIALDGCSFDVEQGKIYALIGPNGSGKSTLFHTIFNQLKKDTGTVSFNKEDITKLTDYAIAKKGISRTFQEVRLFKHLTVEEHMAIALSLSDESLVGAFVKEKRQTKRMKAVLDLVGFNKPLSTRGSDLSYGQRKLLDLAIAIAQPHKLLLLDEPVAGVNPKLRDQIKDILRTLKKQGETILVIEHDMNFIMDLADHVVVLDEGKVLTEGPPAKVQNDKKVLEAYLGA